MIKKVLALIMTMLMLVSFAGLTASASENTPTKLFVGEKDKTDDNLIAMYHKEKHPITVYSVKDSDAYYTLDYINGDFVLTFYNYEYSEAVEYGMGKYGVYCDGDLIIELYGTTKLDLNKNPEKEGAVSDAYGIYVKGTLTIVGYNGIMGTLMVNADKKKASEPTDSIGIYAKNILINRAHVIANGGYAGAVATDTLAVVDAVFKANTDADMFSVDVATDKKTPLFAYGVVTDTFVQGAVYFEAASCYVEVGGDVDINSYVLEDNYDDDIAKFVSKFDVKVVVYLKDFAINESVEGEYKKGKEFKIIDKDLPSCFYTASDDLELLSVSGKTAKVVGGDGLATVGIYLDCGYSTLCFDYEVISCQRTILQKIIDFISYYIFFGWLIAKI